MHFRERFLSKHEASCYLAARFHIFPGVDWYKFLSEYEPTDDADPVCRLNPIVVGDEHFYDKYNLLYFHDTKRRDNAFTDFLISSADACLAARSKADRHYDETLDAIYAMVLETP